MAMVSINIDAMIDYVAALESARADSLWAAGSLQSLGAQAGEWDADCASFNDGESTAQLDALIMDARRRLALAQLIAAAVPGGLPAVDFDDSSMSTLSREEIGELVDQVIFLLENDTGEITQELVDLVAQNSIDPYFAQELAHRLSPQRLADCLSQINDYRTFNIITREQAIPYDEMYNSLLYALAGSYSLAAQGTGDVAVPGFTTTWQEAIKELDFPLSNRVLLLSLVIERGQWPDEFLEGVFDTIRDLEGTAGVEHWAVGGLDLVTDPWPPDPETGMFTLADDPMAGVLAAMANNPNLVGKLFTGGPPISIDTGNGNQADVDSRLWWMLHERGVTEYTINALAQALSAALNVPPVEGGEAWQPNLATDLEEIVHAFEEEGRVADAEFKRSIPHTILDILGFVPAVGAGPDLVNTLWYTVEGDWGNAGVSLAAAIPFVGFFAAGGKWVKTTLNAADLVKITDSASSLPKIPARGGPQLVTAFRSDIADHMANVDSITTKGGVSGGHNLGNFEQAFRDLGVNPADAIVSKTPIYPGVYEIEYRVPLKVPGGALKQPLEWRPGPRPKTVYDPSMYSDAQMLQWGQDAMVNARPVAGKPGVYEGVASNGIKFEARMDNGVFVNLYPVKP